MNHSKALEIFENWRRREFLQVNEIKNNRFIPFIAIQKLENPPDGNNDICFYAIYNKDETIMILEDVF